MEQAVALYGEIQKSKVPEYTFQAALHGVDVDDDKDKDKPKQSEIDGQMLPLFGSSETYAGKTDKELEELTSIMMKGHKSWSGTKLKG